MHLLHKFTKFGKKSWEFPDKIFRNLWIFHCYCVKLSVQCTYRYQKECIEAKLKVLEFANLVQLKPIQQQKVTPCDRPTLTLATTTLATETATKTPSQTPKMGEKSTQKKKYKYRSALSHRVRCNMFSIFAFPAQVLNQCVLLNNKHSTDFRIGISAKFILFSSWSILFSVNYVLCEIQIRGDFQSDRFAFFVVIFLFFSTLFSF